MHQRRTPPWLRAAVLGALLAVPLPLAAFRDVEIGAKLPVAILPTLDGGKAPLVDSARAISVFMFFRPDQEHSASALRELAACQVRLRDRSIHWIGVVSDFYPVDDARRAVREAGFGGPVLLDKGDALYGQFGVKLHPSVGIADGKGTLLAYEPFRKINYCVVIEARVLHALGLLDAAGLARALDPPRAAEGGDGDKARRNVKFAELMRKAGKPDKALELARTAVAEDPASADAHALVGAILVDKGDCAGARPALARALELAPGHALATQAMAACQASTQPAAP